MFIPDRHWRMAGAAAALTIALMPVGADAHVTVLPREAAAQTAPELTIRVPNEKEVPTESIRVEFPETLRVLRLKPTAGWTAELERDAMGRIVAVTYAGARINPQEYQEFSLIARLPEQPGPLRLKAYQRYAGGVEVAWVNEAEPQPAPQVVVTPAAAPAPAGADAFAAVPTGTAASLAGNGNDQQAGTGRSWMSGTSLALSIVAVILALRPRRSAAR